MREMASHAAGRVFLGVLLLSVVGLIAAIALGALEAAGDDPPPVFFGWVTMPLAIGAGFVGIWLVAYLVYFVGFWPFR